MKAGDQMRERVACRCILFILLLLCALCSCAGAEEEPLFIAQEGWKQGFINSEGEWVIEPIYTKVWPFTSAGYAAVETEEIPLWSTFKLIDRQGNIVADLPDWRLDYNDSYVEGFSVQNAVGQAFVLTSVNDMYRSALYLADTGELIELDQSFLEYNLSPGAEINVTYYSGSARTTLPYGFYLLDWNDRMVLAFKYLDFHKGLRGSAKARVIGDDYCVGFVILDRNGRKVHDGCFNDLPVVISQNQEIREYRLTSSFLLTGCELSQTNVFASLIDRNGNVLMTDLPEGTKWTDDGQALVLPSSEEVILLPGQERISALEYAKKRAAESPYGLAIFGEEYYTAEGDPVVWLDPDHYKAKTGFNADGIAWIYGYDGEYQLINTQGTRIAEGLQPACFDADGPILNETGWQCVFPLESGGYGYVDATGTLMYQGFPFHHADPFQNGLAHVQVLDEQYEPLNAYINSSGRVVWAEQGREKDVQQWLDQHEHHTVSDMTIDDAHRALVGEWDCTGGGEFIGEPVIFYEDGTCNTGADHILKWDVIENTAGDEYYWNSPPFALVFGDDEGFETLEEGMGLIFGSTDTFYLTEYDGGSSYVRVPSGYWARDGYNLEADEDGNLEVAWKRDTVLPKEPPEFGLTDSKFTGESAAKTGVLAFRGSPYRQNAVAGCFGSITEPEMIWQADIGPAMAAEEINWQPLIVKWPREVRNSVKILSDGKQNTSALKEVIAVGTDHSVHFYDLEDGKETRPVIDGTEEGLHGTGSLPVAFPVLFVPAQDGFACYDLRDNSRKTELDDILSTYYQGRNVLYQGGWLLMDNGYTGLAHLAINLHLDNGILSDDGIGIEMTDPYLTKYPNSWINDVPASADGSVIYTVSGSSLVRHYTLTDQEADWTEDEFWANSRILSAVAVDHPQGKEGALYFGSSELWSNGTCEICRINAETMDSVWKIFYPLDKTLPYPGGVLSSPVIGQEGLAEIVYFTVTGLSADEGESAVIAVHKDTGKKLWSLPMQARTVSSPVAVYTGDGTGYLIQTDGDGVMYVADGLTGKLLYRYELGGKVTSSPAAYSNMLVIRCQKDGREMLCGVRIGE